MLCKIVDSTAAEAKLLTNGLAVNVTDGIPEVTGWSPTKPTWATNQMNWSERASTKIDNQHLWCAKGTDSKWVYKFKAPTIKNPIIMDNITIVQPGEAQTDKFNIARGLGQAKGQVEWTALTSLQREGGEMVGITQSMWGGGEGFENYVPQPVKEILDWIAGRPDMNEKSKLSLLPGYLN